ncbi:MAG: hypothetical protein KQI62_05770 [Deltaproteobacteria bacterium]|nr:hypothetical protein [Deltaproteobacteria bacterium]
MGPTQTTIIDPRDLFPANRGLPNEFNQHERESFEAYVNQENLAMVQGAIGSDQDIEAILFWDRGGKFDDPVWKELTPLGQASTELMAAATAFYADKRRLAVRNQRRQDLSLGSGFNRDLLFSGLAGAVRCGPDGRPDETGRFLRGVELRLVGSVGVHYNSISIMPLPAGDGYAVQLGTPPEDGAPGQEVNTSDPFSLVQLAYLVHNDLPQAGYQPSLTQSAGDASIPPPSEVRKANRQGRSLGLQGEVRLHVRAEVGSVEQALALAEDMARIIYKRFGMEIEIYKIGRSFPNMFLLRNEQFDQMVRGLGPDDRGLVFMTYTLECRRCRRELAGFTRLARQFPQVKFAMINMNAPHVKFQKRVFGDAVGGDPNQFARSTTATTPFSFIYKWETDRGLSYQGYVATAKDEPPPSLEMLMAKIREFIF